jgi:hypothetical protein
MVTFATGITRPFDAAYYTGTSAGSAQAGTVYDIALGGRGYMLDLLPEGGGIGYSVKSLPLLQRYYLTQTSGVIGEQSLNPSDYWRRSVDSWVNGSGQKNNDHDTSIRSRFHESKGIDCWTPGQISLLKDTTHLLTSANTNLFLAIAGSYLYTLDGNALKYTTSTSFTTVTGTALSSPTAITSDGYTVWLVDANRTNYTTRGNATYAKYHTSDHVATLVRSVKGRLFTANANILYTHSGAAGSATATAFYTHPNSDFTWVDVAEGPTAIYFAGYSGDKSIIYQTAVLADGTNLTIPTAAAVLPSGEIVRSICGYLGVMMIGTDKGVRVAAIDSSGNLTVGDLISTPSVRCFEPQGSFVWFGWTNYDSTSTGLGRIDLGTFNNSSPAYASDLMATAQGIVSSVVTFGTARTYAVQGSGIWTEHATNKVASGTITSGLLNYALPDPKMAVKFVVSYLMGAGTITASLATDNSTFVQMGAPITTSAADGANSTLPASLAVGLVHEVKLTFTRGTDNSQSPVVDRWTLLVNPAPERRVIIDVALMLHSKLDLRNGKTKQIDPLFERAQIDAWLQSNQVITYQDAQSSYAVTVDDYEWKAYANVGATQRSWDGTMMVTLKEIR